MTYGRVRGETRTFPPVIRDEKGNGMARSLNDIMQMDHPIRVEESGGITENLPGVYAPEVHIDAHWDKHGDAHVMREHEQAVLAELRRQGWDMVAPRRAFGTYGSPFMDRAEFIGGYLEEDIREAPGVYVVVTVELLAAPDDERYVNESPEPYGWAVLKWNPEHLKN